MRYGHWDTSHLKICLLKRCVCCVVCAQALENVMVEEKYVVTRWPTIIIFQCYEYLNVFSCLTFNYMQTPCVFFCRLSGYLPVDFACLLPLVAREGFTS